MEGRLVIRLATWASKALPARGEGMQGGVEAEEGRAARDHQARVGIARLLPGGPSGATCLVGRVLRILCPVAPGPRIALGADHHNPRVGTDARHGLARACSWRVDHHRVQPISEGDGSLWSHSLHQLCCAACAEQLLGRRLPAHAKPHEDQRCSVGCGRLPEQPLARQVGEVGHDGQRSLGSKDRAVHDFAARVQLCTAECLRRLRWPPRLLCERRERQDHRRARIAGKALVQQLQVCFQL